MLANSANVLSRLGRPTEALEQYRKALSIYRDLIDNQGEAAVLGNIGVVYAHLGPYAEALDQYRHALGARRRRRIRRSF